MPLLLCHFDSSSEEREITHYFSHPSCPKENAFVERKIQTTKYELWAFRGGTRCRSLTRYSTSGTMFTIV